MKAKAYIRISLVILVVSISLVLFSYSHKNSSANPGNADCSGKCEEKKAQTEFSLWESLSRVLFSANR